MRCEQYIGLNDWAAELISPKPVVVGTQVVTNKYNDDRPDETKKRALYEDTVAHEPYSSFDGAFGGEYELDRYTLPDGTRYFEYVQEAPWSSGPMYFIALKDIDNNPVPESLWTEEMMEVAGYV